MNKIISFILLCSLLLVCFSGCVTNGGKAPADDSATSNNGTTADNGTTQDNSTENNDNTTPDNTATDDTTPDNTAPDNTGSEQTPPDENNNDTSTTLDHVLNMIAEDVANNDKMAFNTIFEDLHYEFKASGEYENSDWSIGGFDIIVYCNYDYATEEDWYKQCAEKDTKSLNDAFYNYYSSAFQNKENYYAYDYRQGVYLCYISEECLKKDYCNIKALLDLDYVFRIYIAYNYSLPNDYFYE